MKYHIKQFRPGRWHVVDEAGQPLYDDERDGNDRPLIFTDPDIAQQCADNKTKILNPQPHDKETKID